MKQKHTPGPWSQEGTVVYIGKTGDFLPNGEPNWGGFDLRNCPLPEANARLIAAAPELLEALIYARRFLKPDDVDTAFIDAAIAKATRKTQ